MIVTIISYFVAVFTAMFTQLVLMLAWPLLFPLKKTSNGLALSYVFLCYVAIGLLAVWWSSFVFGWFDREPTFLLVGLLALTTIRFKAPGGATVLATKYEISFGKDNNDFQYLIMFAEISGLAIGAFLLFDQAKFI
jgi:hypothetical protein